MQNIFYHPIIIADLTGAEKRFNIKTSANQSAYVAEVLRIAGVDELSAQIYVKANKNIIKVYGNIRAMLELTSVISLENFKKEQSVDFELTYDSAMNYQQQRELENEGKEAPDIVENGKIDLADVIIEQLALHLDDYPRKAGEEFSF